MPKKLLIANRAEIAIRVARTCTKMGIKPCAIYSDADKNSLHVKYCDESINIGGSMPSESYLKPEKIIDAAKRLDCELIHPGYGFLSENSKFAGICKKEGLIFVGPPVEAMDVSGDKARARKIASKVAPVVDGEEISNESQAITLAENIGYPVILKAVEGGGGRGLRIVNSSEELSSTLISSINESTISFGSGRIYIEKYVQNPRHIEVQILADELSAIQLGERECSIQRRHQKLIEESPSAALTSEMRSRITKAAIEVMREIGYQNAGTVEFLFKDGKFYFMEVNARIQVEHPVTEAVTGVDIVEQQLNIALGKGLSIKQDDIEIRGHAIECRINTEHPLTFVPFAGTVKKLVVPTGDGIRVDTSLYSGYSIPVFYDSLIAKMICIGDNRIEAIEKMKASLKSFRISGIPSTISFHISALNDKRFVEGRYDTSFVDRMEPFSSKDGEIPAAIFYVLPKKTKFISAEENQQDPWIRSRFDWIDTFGILYNNNNSDINRWAR